MLTLKLTMDFNACGFEGCPARVTNSISPLSYRTLRPWCSVPWAHPLDPSSRLQRENPGIGKRVPQPKPIQAPQSIRGDHQQNTGFFDSIDPPRTSATVLYEMQNPSKYGRI